MRKKRKRVAASTPLTPTQERPLGGEEVAGLPAKSFERLAKVRVIRASGGVKVLINTGAGRRRRWRWRAAGGGEGEGGGGGGGGEPVKRIAVSTLNYSGWRSEEERRKPNNNNNNSSNNNNNSSKSNNNHNNNNSNNNILRQVKEEDEDEDEDELLVAVKERENRMSKRDANEERRIRAKRTKRRKREANHHHRGHTENRLPPPVPLAIRPRETPLRQLPRASEANARTQVSRSRRHDSFGILEDASEKSPSKKENCETPSAPSGKMEVVPNGRRCSGGRKGEVLGRPYTFEDMVAEAERKREGYCSPKTDGAKKCLEARSGAPEKGLQGSDARTNAHAHPKRRVLPPLPPLRPLAPDGKVDAGVEAKGSKTRRPDEGKVVVWRRRDASAKRGKETLRESDLASESVRVKVEPKEDEGESVKLMDATHHPVIFSGGVGMVTGHGGVTATSLPTTALASSAHAAHAAPYTIRLNLAGLQHVKPTIVIISTGKGKRVCAGVSN
ncbi:uncharacterized protein DDB_G0287625-like [Scylla paramamosain]|uniref:uncharacterized protein DDB_G0287625-like n=1 Tax=Scylla paramamosain TaxID=85552 RepID=UPI003083A702